MCISKSWHACQLTTWSCSDSLGAAGHLGVQCSLGLLLATCWCRCQPGAAAAAFLAQGGHRLIGQHVQAEELTKLARACLACFAGYRTDFSTCVCLGWLRRQPTGFAEVAANGCAPSSPSAGCGCHVSMHRLGSRSSGRATPGQCRGAPWTNPGAPGSTRRGGELLCGRWYAARRQLG